MYLAKVSGLTPYFVYRKVEVHEKFSESPNATKHIDGSYTDRAFILTRDVVVPVWVLKREDVRGAAGDVADSWPLGPPLSRDGGILFQ